jgi:hypothetical protein
VSRAPSVDRLLPFGISFAATSVFFIDICALLFDCGCRSLWAGADAMCNVHVADGPHCPFCSHGVAGYAVVMFAVSAPQLAVSMWTRWSRTTRAVACLILFPAAMALVGATAGWWEGYWTGR